MPLPYSDPTKKKIGDLGADPSAAPAAPSIPPAPKLTRSFGTENGVATNFGDSGYEQLQRGIMRQRDDNAVAADPAGPPAMVAPPVPPVLNRGVRVDPAASTLQQEGALRPPTGLFSASNPQPMANGAGQLIRPTDAAPGLLPLSPPPNLTRLPTPATRDAAVPTLATAIAPPAPVFSNTATGSAGTAVIPTLSRGGRALGYGSTDSNGVRSFGNDDVAAINNRATGLSRADAGIGGGIGSAALGNGGGLAGTPELGTFNGGVGTGLTRAPAPINTYARAQADNVLAQKNAMSDLQSIANRDTRSGAGLAARNADIDAGSTFGTPSSRKKTFDETISGLNAGARSLIQPTGEAGVAGIQDAGATDRANINAGVAEQSNATELKRAMLARPIPQHITLADGTLGLLGQDGTVQPALGTDGKVVRPQATKSPVDSAAYGKMLSENINRILGIDLDTGLMRDPTVKDPKDAKAWRQPTPAELYRATTQASQITRNGFGTNDGQGPQAPPPDDSSPIYVDANGNRARWVNGQYVPEG